jgi:hypothetical protein
MFGLEFQGRSLALAGVFRVGYLVAKAVDFILNFSSRTTIWCWALQHFRVSLIRHDTLIELCIFFTTAVVLILAQAAYHLRSLCWPPDNFTAQPAHGGNKQTR